MRFNLPFLERLFALTHRHQVTPLLASLTFLMFLFYPANQLPITQVTLYSYSLALAFGVSSALISFGFFEASRKKRVKFTLLSLWLIVCSAIFVISALYQHALSGNAYLQTLLLFLAVGIFISLQQFHFLYQQRQYLLWLPLLLGWLYFPASLTLLTLALLSELGIKAYTPLLPQTYTPEAPSVILLTAFVLSAYLLARSKCHKKPWSHIHIPLLLTPLLCIPSLFAWQEAWANSALMLSLIMVQAFLFQYCTRPLHLAWNISALLGLSIAVGISYLFNEPLFSAVFSVETKAMLRQTIDIILHTRFEGIGLGQLEQVQLLFGQLNNQQIALINPYPSWLIVLIAEGGIATWLPLFMLAGLMIKRLMLAPAATRLMLLSILMPSLLGMIFTPYASSQPLLILLFVLLLYWLDNLSARYYRFPLAHTKHIRVMAFASLLSITGLTVSSLYLSYQADNVYRLNDNQIERFRLHPWWGNFYQKHKEERLFLHSLINQDQAQQNAFLSEQIRKSAHSPTPAGYQNLITLAYQTNNIAIAEHIKAEATLLFPLDPLFMQKSPFTPKIHLENTPFQTQR